MGNYWRFENNPFWHHECREFDAGVFARIIGGLVTGAVATQICLASLFLFIKPDQHWVGSVLFLVALIFHLIARIQVDRQIPRRSFV
ncbi:MAG: hypothetical protein ACK40X_13160, partial [Armatimonadota bacterium]